ncbi:MAG TPA: hypothetical protein VFL85_01585 [Candidatus Saccharimonadales bacterium]|nr:hypothetical protein [Candidatus Saccharimonadales bacterium]
MNFTEYGKYNATIKTVIDSINAMNGGYCLDENDTQALAYAIEDLQNIKDKMEASEEV